MRDPHPLERRLGVLFQDPDLLRTALTHKSTLNERPDATPGHNERLEFLGDAILGAAVADELYRAYPTVDEGALTNMRISLVRQSTLAEWAVRYRVGEHLLLGRGEEQRGGRTRPALLASAFEAVIGALYLDQGWPAVQQLVLPLVREASASLSPSARSHDPKSELQYRAQARFGTPPGYRIVRMDGPEHRPSFTVEVVVGEDLRVQGRGPSKQAAEQDAARRLLAEWPEPAAGEAS